MRKLLKIAIIFSSLGIILILLAFILNGNKLPLAGETKPPKYHAIESKNLKNLKFHVTKSDIDIEPSNSDKIEVEYREGKNFYFSIEENADILLIKDTYKEKWFNFSFDFGFNFNNHYIKLKIPKELLVNLSIKNINGNISLKDLHFKDIQINDISGDINLSKLNTNNINLNSKSGNIRLNNIKAENNKLDIYNLSGNVLLKDIINSGSTNITTTSGNIIFDNIVSKNIDSKTTSGNIEFSNSNNIIDNFISESTSGNIIINEIKINKKLSLKNISGNIKTKISDKEENFNKNINNKNNTDSNSSLKNLNITNTSGNIDIDFIGY
ncbi:DUF4097 family beta strand repeat-containing protein [Gemella massiliensis]|uniref:DUF4097 family beta strand repeat-containing protein n=1 Tax=Gemella massiliensis TaxID=1909670 RepID=UPI00092FD9BF|nr:DUF4097 family beta strand repeat-containing protein [Gemella massiliensis]